MSAESEYLVYVATRRTLDGVWMGTCKTRHSAKARTPLVAHVAAAEEAMGLCINHHLDVAGTRFSTDVEHWVELPPRTHG